MLRQCRLTNPTELGFAECWDCYESSFPVNERRPLRDHLVALSDERFTCLRFDDGLGFVGLLHYWTLGKLIYVEHVAIAAARRGEGLGSRILKHLIGEARVPIILEIEPMEDEVSRARWRFYRKLGFCLLKDEHWQPLYHSDDAPLRLRLLSYPMPLDSRRVLHFQTELRRVVESYRQD